MASTPDASRLRREADFRGQKKKGGAGRARAERHQSAVSPRGGIVGMADLIRWHDTPPDMPFAFYGGIELANPEPLSFMPIKGHLGFFKVTYPAN